MTDRALLRAGFLDSVGWRDAAIAALPGDASFRRYFRLRRPDGARAMLMDAPPPRENVRPFRQIAVLLQGLGYSAPRIFAADAEAGFLLLEDLGDDTYTRLIAGGADEAALYYLAIDVLINLHERFHPGAASSGIPDYGDGALLTEAALLTDWFLPEAWGTPVPEAVRAEYLALWQEILPLARQVPDSLVLRDYHIDNLMLLPDRPGVRACGLLDFQDAMIGPISYDLVSLIEDARRDVPQNLRDAIVARYLAARPHIDAAALGESLAILGAQRHAKVIGIFCRLLRRDGKPTYLRHLPRLWGLLEARLAHPALAPLQGWFERYLPQPLRAIPQSLIELAATLPPRS